MSRAGARPEARYSLDQIVEGQSQEGEAILD